LNSLNHNNDPDMSRGQNEEEGANHYESSNGSKPPVFPFLL
jgi:hypothetical protein